MEYGIYEDFIIIYRKPYSMYVRGTIRSLLGEVVQGLHAGLGGFTKVEVDASQYVRKYMYAYTYTS